EAHAVKAHPMPDAHADGGDLVFGAEPAVGALHPYPHAPFAQLALHVEVGKRRDEPALEISDIGADIWLAALQIKHHIGHALARPMIGVLAAPACLEDGE